MSASTSSLRWLARCASSFKTPLKPSHQSLTPRCLATSSKTSRITSIATSFVTRRPFSSTVSRAQPMRRGENGNETKRKAKRKRNRDNFDPKIHNLVMALESPHKLPPLLRMARNRHLRHWTIHRAWLLYRRQQREARERELMKMYQSMHGAMECLRLTEGPGRRPEGYLYRVATEKKGVWKNGAVPIEYARPLVETPGREPWNHEWKRT